MRPKQSNWSTLKDIRKILLERWEKGTFFLTQEKSEDVFPYKISLRKPSSHEFSDRYNEVCDWAEEYTQEEKKSKGIILWKEVRHKIIGKNQYPEALLFQTVEQLAAYINKQREYQTYLDLRQKLLAVFPELEKWVNRYPKKLLVLSEELDPLIRITQWKQGVMEEKLYIREISLPGVHTKFVERHKALLSEWWDILLPEHDIDENQRGARLFEKRFGFKTKPELIRLRILDKNYAIQGLLDLTIPLESFQTLSLSVKKIFIVENDITALSFPPVSDSMVLFGRGYGFEGWSGAEWLRHKQLHYWGDIDTHGFAILNQFRKHFPQTLSFLMTKNVLLKHRENWSQEKRPVYADLEHLTPDEYKLYQDLKENRWESGVRLEQELISMKWVQKQL